MDAAMKYYATGPGGEVIDPELIEYLIENNVLSAAAHTTQSGTLYYSGDGREKELFQ